MLFFREMQIATVEDELGSKGSRCNSRMLIIFPFDFMVEWLLLPAREQNNYEAIS
jgi:hypothetical protein